jgi:hypothetical protein
MRQTGLAVVGHYAALHGKRHEKTHASNYEFTADPSVVDEPGRIQHLEEDVGSQSFWFDTGPGGFREPGERGRRNQVQRTGVEVRDGLLSRQMPLLSCDLGYNLACR